MKKRVGVQRELNEIAEELVRQDIEVTDMLDTTKPVDAIVFYNEESDLMNGRELYPGKRTVMINAAKTNIDEMVRKIKNI